MSKIQSYLPIEQRIYRSKSTSIDILTANTFVVAQRNLVNDGKSKKSSLSRSDSFSYKELVKFHSDIEAYKEKGEITNPLEIPMVIYSLKTLEAIDFAQLEFD